MKVKDSTVQTMFHPMLTSFLFYIDDLYIEWGSEVILTSGSEPTARHSITSLHYATPAQAADIRTWSKSTHNRGLVPSVSEQGVRLSKLALSFCKLHKIPANWIEIIIESDHIHIEYQPKRQD